MLVIRRRAAESFFLGDDIEVEVLSIDGNQVKLGIRAPKEVVILRREVRELTDINRHSAQSELSPALANLIDRFRR